MTRDTPDQGQRVDDPATVSGDAPVRAEPDSQSMKEGMADAAKGSDDRLKRTERDAEEDLQAVRPDHRGNDAGQ